MYTMISVLLHVQFAGQASERDEVRSKCVECTVSSILGLACCTVTVDFSRCLYSTSNYYVESTYIFQHIVCQLQKIAKSESGDIQLVHIVPLT